MIISGYTIYPSHIENAFMLHPAVSSCCVIGVPDDYKMQKVKAFVVLKDGAVPGDEMKKELLEHIASTSPATRCRTTLSFATPCRKRSSAKSPTPF